MAEKQYLLPVWTDTRIRHYHRTERGHIVNFTLQLEVEVEGAWRAVIRYDTAHGFAHIDRYSLAGKQTKERLRLDFGEALTRAERDLKHNWLAYIESDFSEEDPHDARGQGDDGEELGSHL